MFASFRSKLLAGSLMLAGAVPVFAEGEPTTVTIPDAGVDITAYATSAITTLGGVVAVCVGGVICFMLVRWGIRWVRGIGRG